MKKKFVWNPARIFFHNTGTEKLETLAKEGWSVEKLRLGGLLFQLKEDEPKEVQYHIDFQSFQNTDEAMPQTDEGWELVDALDYMAVFQGSPEALSMEGNQEQLLEQLNQEGRLLGKYTILSSIFLIIFFILHIKVGWDLIKMILLGGIIMGGIAFILVLALYILNRYRRYNLKNT